LWLRGRTLRRRYLLVNIREERSSLLGVAPNSGGQGKKIAEGKANWTGPMIQNHWRKDRGGESGPVGFNVSKELQTINPKGKGKRWSSARTPALRVMAERGSKVIGLMDIRDKTPEIGGAGKKREKIGSLVGQIKTDMENPARGDEDSLAIHVGQQCQLTGGPG